MSFIRFELDALSSAGITAGLLGIDHRIVTGGLLDLWAWAWREGVEEATGAQVAGAFGPAAPRDRLLEALEAGGFVELVEGGRVAIRGIGKYLRVSDRRAKAGRDGAAKRWQTDSKPMANGSQTDSKPMTSDGVDPRSEIRDPKEPESEAMSARADPPDAAAGPPAFGVAELRAAWNELADPALPRWLGTGTKRGRAAKARLREHPEPAYWRDVITRISASAFCRALTGGTWRASPDWLVQPDTAGKVLEGKYDDRKATGPPAVRRGPVRAEDVSWAGKQSGPVDWSEFTAQEKPHG